MPTITLNTLFLIGSAESTTANTVPNIQVDTLTLTGTANRAYPKAPAVSESEIALLRSQSHEMRLWGNVLEPFLLWTAQINDPSAGRSTTTIAFDNGSGVGFPDSRTSY